MCTGRDMTEDSLWRPAQEEPHAYHEKTVLESTPERSIVRVIWLPTSDKDGTGRCLNKKGYEYHSGNERREGYSYGRYGSSWPDSVCE